jgi:putative transcriptional regulator
VKNRIKVLRAEKDWSQEELGNRLGVSRQAINAIERCKHDPSLQLAFSIAEIFEQTIEEVFQPESPLVKQPD